VASVGGFVDSRYRRKLICYPVNHTVAIVPARLASTRLPGKALIEISGKPMVCWVAERARAARNVDRVIVATDSQQIVDAVTATDIEAVLTAADHTSGTDRVAEVAAGIPEASIIVNVQGDEPMIAPETIERAVDAMVVELAKSDGAGIVTTWEPLESIEDLLNPDLVKVVLDGDDNAVYFSRSPVPYPRDAIKTNGSLAGALEKEPQLLKLFRKHTGLYVYRRDVLLEFTKWPQAELEKIEALEQLRALIHGVKIKVVEASAASTGIDTFADLERVKALLESPKRPELSRA
jgi:3-deoxy-manno-octulosonate cytidylyltransferase (CMP-KDO synthetase)